MPGSVRQLPEEVVNQIAAGEVVERTASVLKEILENAVDAKATRVEAEIGGPFPFHVRVSDDGQGMTAAEVGLAVRRHTTSKISSAEDLHRIGTYGFRGEALPSIASVSRLRIATRRARDPSGTEILVEAGALRYTRDAGVPPGTTVEVQDLFGNVPARRKFLKTPRTELGHLWEAFHGVAIPSGGIAFRMTDGRAEFSYEKGESREERAAKHAGSDAKYLVPVRLDSPFFRISGLAGLPHLSRFGASGIHFFVNGRAFRDKGVFAAVREAYRGLLPADRHPVIYLFIDCDPGEVDVNVHPAKAEARFRYPKELFELVRHALGEAMGESRVPASPGPAPAPSGPPVPAPSYRVVSGPSLFGRESVTESLDAGRAGELPGEGGFSSLRPVGQVLGTYFLCEGADGIVIVDQHAADERIVFSRLKDSYLGKGAAIQRWLVPQVLALQGMDREERGEVERFLSRAGFTFETFGENTLKVTGGPAILGTFDVQRWWQDFSDFLALQGSAPKGIFDADRELWRLACHTSLRGGAFLEKEGMRTLLSELDRAVASHSCPHGRPVWVRVSASEMARMFGRSG